MQKCLSCSEIEDPKMCKNETTCAKDEICYLHKYTTHTKQQLFDVGCKHSSLCTQGYSNILGRRSSDGVHQECESCCSGAVFCNHDLQCNHVPRQNVSERCTSDHQCKQSLSCEQNICKCVVNKFWNGSLCEPKKTFHSTCSSSDECLDTLYCNHGYCKCDASVDYWNGSSCLTGKLYNESCSNSVKCQGTFRCINNKCSCLSSEYLEGSQCLTRKLFNESCSNSVKCQGTFRCINNKCSCLSSEYLEGSQCLTKKLECEDVEGSHDGVYTIYPGGGDMAVTVYCIMRQAKKWTVIQRRVNGSVDFYRTWHEYKKGFGSVYGEYWLGNDNINIISTNGFHELSIYMEQSNLHRMANYSNFIVDNERNKYRLTVTGYSGDAGDSMNPVDDREKSNGQPFTTKDRDNDDNSNNCAVSHRSAWWYANCFGSELNRPYSGSAGTMYWVTWRSDISKSIVMIRRKS
ncbi:uncharacterized protein LOC143052132 [Mytilus galloprovincialis]|uniref:uncharacterized protein LOC143052132 n=1 Tax=Mytilus galloprovincialis TaxID=29158 RepID=UPI003F7BFBBF